jgi:hypothetical protein
MTKYYEPGPQDARSSYWGFAITKSDSINFTKADGTPLIVRGIYVGGTGDVVLVNPDLSTVTFTAVPGGTIIPCECVRINSTNTTATSMVGLA